MSTPSPQEVKKMPKVELHRHVDGAVSPDLVWRLCEEQSYEVEAESPEELADDLKIVPDMDFNKVLDKFSLVIDLMQTYGAIRKVFLNQVLDLQGENIVYAELRFAPAYHTREGLSLEEVIEAALDGLRQGEKMAGGQTKANLIVCINRECSSNEGERIAEAALSFQHEGVVGIDLACNEADYPPEKHARAFRKTLGTKLKRTVHAGEFGPQTTKNVRTAFLDLKANRLGHGIPVAKQDYLMKACRDRHVLVESCPASNVICGFIDSPEDLELDVLLENNVDFCINSDDPALFHKSLSEALLETAEAYGWGMDELVELQRTALKNAFITYEERAKILPRLR